MKLFYQQTDGLQIETEYFIDELDDPSLFNVVSLGDLTFTPKKLNLLPDKRFIRFAEHGDETIFLLDTNNLNPEGNPLILLNAPVYQFCIPLTNSFATLLECACLGILAVIEEFAIREGKSLPQIPNKMMKRSKTILPYLKEFFTIAKREYELLDIWHISPKARKLLETSISKWFKGLKKLLVTFNK
ncbi:MAG: hypothetical protein FK733_06695 [Asgard group archaeon]|nr:hypothetical protein [Asgard group archaeon]